MRASENVRSQPNFFFFSFFTFSCRRAIENRIDTEKPKYEHENELPRRKSNRTDSKKDMTQE